MILVVVVTLVVLLVCLVTVTVLQTHFAMNLNTPNSKIKWTVVSEQKCEIDSTIKKILDSYGIGYSPHERGDWEIYIPCTYNNLSNQIQNVPKTNSPKKIFILDDADEICGKDRIWDNLCKAYGRDTAKQIMPTTYILHRNEDIARLNKEYEEDKLYILKKNIQRQEGLLISDDKKEILEAKSQGYVIVQELLQDPYLIDGRKINMRFYVLVVCNQGKMEAYVHNNGFMYYTADKFKKGVKDNGINITTGYIDREVYEKNPLTHDDFRKFLDSGNRDMTAEEIYLLATRHKLSNYVFSSIYSLLAMVVAGLQQSICRKDSTIANNMTFQLFGADIAINDKLEPQLMEFNKGPDLDAKDERDKQVKLTMVKDMFSLLDITPSTESRNGFVKVI